MPDYSLLTDAVVGESIPLGLWLSAVNDRIRTHLGHDARNQQIGHAYLIENGRPVADFAHFSRILAEDILPLLEEYCYEDYASLALILGQGLVDEGRQRIRGELFDSGRRDDLIQALLAPNPDIATSPQVVTLDEIADEPEDAESDEEASG